MPGESCRMPKIAEAKNILAALGLHQAQQNDISALTLLALCGVTEKDDWSSAIRQSLRITKGLMSFISSNYGRTYAPNTRETFRRQVLHQFVQAGIADYNPDDPGLPTNSPRAHYSISREALKVIRAFNNRNWTSACQKFAAQKTTLWEVHSNKRKMALVPVRVAKGKKLFLSPGSHNEIQAAIVEEFAPRFAPGARLLYLGDTANKSLYVDAKALARLGIELSDHRKLPDVILFDSKKDAVFLVEAVTSHGPMSPKRVIELKCLFSKCAKGLVLVTAFPDFARFRAHMKDIAWETEVWIANIEDHLIHFDGDKFIFPK
jgi:type II restriction enzyme